MVSLLEPTDVDALSCYVIATSDGSEPVCSAPVGAGGCERVGVCAATDGHVATCVHMRM